MNQGKIEKKVSGTEFSIFMRQLHILALVQHSTASEYMNYRSMADLLDLVPWDENIDSKKIGRCVEKLKEMGFPVHTGKGEQRVMLDRELGADEMLEILPYYLNVVTDTVGIRDCFKSYVENHGSRSLWIMARIYFASLEKKRIKLSYRSVNNNVPDTYILNPYRWIYRDNAVYLIAKNISRGDNVSLFRLNRIRDVDITDDRFEDDIPSAYELLKHSMGSFINNRYYNVKLMFRFEDKERIEEDFGHLELMFADSHSDGYGEVTFTVCDLINVCKAVFSYCGRVEIIDPPEAVSEMKRMIEGNNIY